MKAEVRDEGQILVRCERTFDTGAGAVRKREIRPPLPLPLPSKGGEGIPRYWRPVPTPECDSTKTPNPKTGKKPVGSTPFSPRHREIWAKAGHAVCCILAASTYTVRIMRDPGLVQCKTHGAQAETLVCQHIVASLCTGVAVGFFWASSDDNPRPDAWCAACAERLSAAGGDWTEALAQQMGFRLLCAACYEQAKLIWLNARGELN
jgi:hypothetical protein